MMMSSYLNDNNDHYQLLTKQTPSHDISRTRIIMVNTIPFPSLQHKTSLDIIELLRKQYQPEIEIDVGYSRSEKQELQTKFGLSIKNIYEQIILDNKKVVPYYHPISLFHYQYIYPRFSHRMSYSTYLLLEERFADIIQQYLQDSRNYKYLLVFSDPTWFHDESLLSYLSFRPNKQSIIRYFVKDLDNITPSSQTNIIIPDPSFAEFNIFLCDIFSHPFL